MTNEKYFQETISKWELDHYLFTNFPRFIVVRDFSRSSFYSNEVSYLPWQNSYPNLKTACHIKQTFFLWVKILEKWLLEKYLLSVTAILNIKMENVFKKVSCISFLFAFSKFHQINHIIKHIKLTKLLTIFYCLLFFQKISFNYFSSLVAKAQFD